MLECLLIGIRCVWSVLVNGQRSRSALSLSFSLSHSHSCLLSAVFLSRKDVGTRKDKAATKVCVCL